MENNNEAFSFTYSAKQQEEIRSIRQKYLPREADKMEQLRRLDKRAERSGTLLSIIVGVTGSMLLGLGLACILRWKDFFISGVMVGVVGLIGVALAYPVFLIRTQQERKKLAPEIMKLIDELSLS
ncbi:hypothetical protein R70723_11990 [Paenibacillus sp. FSL R7-0273]|uniref:hypothetical protein n=1 Tax=Paenibacillus sp. FSL R7-0273 TaxID=1536772 RepID=UPI0004F6A992|nr:hypothetical protein [Paenibacillus sp. FSL R7-0273]AIQ46508.1 hypothetical protein R70723_11990 [Paenibacillus sp. FSL R7-0273]OMF97727.1 hypothetical protein BK144_03585 [Paenibacillus sp. FSL R7-0273]